MRPNVSGLWFLLATLLFVSATTLAIPVNAQEILRWKLIVGERLNIESSDQTSLKLAAPLDSLTNDTDARFEMTWDVLDNQSDGGFRIRVKVDRMRYSMTGRLGQSVYDSKSTDRPKGMSADDVSLYEAIANNMFEFILSKRGEVNNVRILRGRNATPDLAIAENPERDKELSDAVRSMISGCLLLLPEKRLAKGDSWNTIAEADMPPGVGKQIVNKRFRYEGIRKVDGKDFARLTSNCEISFKPTSNLKINLQQQIGDGEVLFDEVEGRLHSDKFDHHATIEIVLRGQRVPGSIGDSTRLTVARSPTPSVK